MCIIVDANVVTNIAGGAPSAASKLVINWVMGKGGRIVHGGHLSVELSRITAARRWLATLQRAGRLLKADDEKVATRTQELIDEGACKSNDPHIVALAQVTGARVLYSLDNGLHEDFCNPALVSNPRGSVYQTADHRHLILMNKCPAGACQ